MMPFVGRDNEKARLRTLVSEVEEGKGCALFLGGEAGIGKTRLVNEVLDSLPQQWRILTGYCGIADIHRPFGPWEEILRLLHADRPSDSLPSSLQGIDQLVTDLMNEMADPKWPSMILIEDLQWADSSSLDVLRFLVPRIRRLSVFLCCTYRSDELTHHHPLWRLLPEWRRQGAERMILPRLSPQDIHQLVKEAYPPVDDPLTISSHIFRRTRGVSLFAQELLQWYQEGHGMILDALPDTVLEAIEYRLLRLSEKTLSLMEVAAIIGERFAYDIWEHSVDVFADDLQQALGEAITYRIIRRDESPKIAQTWYQFDHGLVRDVILAKISPSERKRYHRQVAQALMDSDSPDYDALAYHLAESGDILAIQALCEAGNHALALGAVTQAQNHFQRALEMAGTTHILRAEICLKLAFCLDAHDERREQCLVEAMQLADVYRQDAVKAWALYFLALSAQQHSDPQLFHLIGQVELLQQALMGDGEYERLEKALFRSTVPWPRITIPYAASMAIQGNMEQAYERISQIRPLAVQYHGYDLDYADFVLGFLSGHYQAVLRSASRAATKAHQMRQYRDATWFKTEELLFTVVLEPYEIEHADRLAEELQIWEEEAQEQAGSTFITGYSGLGPYQYFRGMWTEARTNLVECALTEKEQAPDPILLLAVDLLLEEEELALARAIASMIRPRDTEEIPPFGSIQALAHGIKAMVWLRLGNMTEAEKWLQAGLRQPTAQLPLMKGYLLFVQAYFAMLNHQDQEALNSAHEAIEYVRQVPVLWYEIALLRLMARIVIRDQRVEEAYRYWDTALTMARRAHFRGIEGIIHYERAIFGPHSSTQIKDLHMSCHIFQDIGAVRLLNRARQVYERHDGRTNAVGLTARETEILERVVQGLTDREIAQDLVISPKTVDRHLRNIFRKLGVSSRTALATRALQEGWL
ncbi:hypothetical protein BFX06_13755 [Sulfobacillus thermosulfidooxidans]|nr:hypothetical protein BFX05_10545 [Sulfobacillus thermosulfidooxidans]OLZ17005.1 hypothetical protein BFX06_13755 [Sulfobacillus thermosulfidooxidans]